MINFERIDWKHQKPQFSIGSKFSPNCMKKCIKHENNWKRRGKEVFLVLQDKNPWKFLRENDKKSCFESQSIKEREKKNFWKSLNSETAREKLMFLKNSKLLSIDRKIDSIDQKLHSFDPAIIEHQSNQADSNQNFNRNFTVRKLTTTITWQLWVHRLLLSWIHSKHKYSHLCIFKFFMQQLKWSLSSWHNLDSW